jgi:NADH-quinone oxidoreductase subunit N
MLLVLGGMGYKLGMVPFHMWVPDTYQGAPTPLVAFLSVAPKAAGVAAIATLFLLGLGGHAASWRPILSLAALLTMAVGNLLALPQTDLRRLLGYSGIAQMGYVLVALVAGDAYAVGMVLFFLAAYVVTNMGAFLVVHAVAEGGAGHDTDALAGLFRRAPVLALGLLLFLLSLAGIPFVAGFWAKLYVFLAAWRDGHELLVVAGVMLAAVGLFYYLRLARAAWMLDPGDLPAPRAAPPLRMAIGLCLGGVLLFGLWPGPVVDSAAAAAKALLAG